MNKLRFEDYPHEIRPLSGEEGGGYLITFPDLPGCMSDGDTPEEALENGKDAFQGWIAAAKMEKIPIPGASSIHTSAESDVSDSTSPRAKQVTRLPEPRREPEYPGIAHVDAAAAVGAVTVQDH